MNMKKGFGLLMLVGFAFILNSCARAQVRPLPTAPSSTYLEPAGSVLRQNTWHVVAPGETLWRISKMYNVKVEDIMRVNNLKKPENLAVGSKLAIRQAAPVQPVITLYPSRRWKYIIIHHSATDKGSSLNFDKLHKRRGWAGIGYDFVIDNGTDSKKDGQIETSPRWIKQQRGAHCQASNMNYQGIGICLVGNFSKERVSKKQLASLVYLVNILKDYYKIPESHILGHGQVPGAKTECPGKYFPWKEFYRQID